MTENCLAEELAADAPEMLQYKDGNSALMTKYEIEADGFMNLDESWRCTLPSLIIGGGV